jgi:hypothetical protein
MGYEFQRDRKFDEAKPIDQYPLETTSERRGEALFHIPKQLAPLTTSRYYFKQFSQNIRRFSSIEERAPKYKDQQ